MSAVMKTQTDVVHIGMDPAIISKLVTTGDLAGLSDPQRVAYYNYRCQQAGLDPAAKPFDLLKLNGKTVLYANASCTQQLCGIHKLSVEITSKDRMDDLYVVCARVKSPDGRSSDNMGAVPTGNLKGEALANAMLKATTKAIRRAVLAHLGLGMLDETEVQAIAGAQTVDYHADPRGDLSSVDNPVRDRHVTAIADILNADVEDNDKAQMLRDYVAEFLQPNNELYIAVGQALKERKIASRDAFAKWMKVGLPAR
jgi:hypothetical protein